MDPVKNQKMVELLTKLGAVLKDLSDEGNDVIAIVAPKDKPAVGESVSVMYGVDDKTRPRIVLDMSYCAITHWYERMKK